jgi:NDP-sugar pyrophosphorylase family protein
MAVVAGQPFVGYLLAQLRQQGFHDVVLCVGHLGDQIREHFGDGNRWGLSIRYAVERQLLATAGALKNAQRLIEGPFLVLNGDSYLDADLREVVAFHQRRRHIPRLAGTLAMADVDDAEAYGTLQVGPGWRIECFREKVPSPSRWISAGVYVLEPQVLDAIPAGRAVSLERETFPALLEQGRRLYGCPMAGFFVDIGTPPGYRAFQEYVAAKGVAAIQTDGGATCARE